MTIESFVFPDPPARIHCVGVKGMQLAPLAELLQRQGYRVSGSDTAEPFPADESLAQAGVEVWEEFDARHITQEIESVVYSAAYPEIHPERTRARELGIPQVSAAELAGVLQSMAAERVCVAGTHGKTTTTAMLATLLTAGKKDPTALVGAPLPAWHSNLRVGNGALFLIEADEYKGKFAFYSPTHLLVTNVDFDHPDFFADKETYNQEFANFVAKVPTTGHVVLCADDSGAQQLASTASAQVTTYGMAETATWRIADYTPGNGSCSFRLRGPEGFSTSITVPFVGEHIARNAAGAVAMAVLLGVPHDCIADALATYAGTARRAERIGEFAGALILDDYAHHPVEIMTAIKGYRDGWPTRRLRVVFQPHTVSRTEQFLSEFGTALAAADEVILLPVYGSAREDGSSFAMDKFASAITTAGGTVTPCESLDTATQLIKKNATAEELIVTMGAGDVWQVGRALLV